MLEVKSFILIVGGGILLTVFIVDGASVWDLYKNNREALTPLGAFAGGAILAWAAFRQARIATRQAAIAAQQANTALLRHQAQTDADLQRRIIESFSKATEQLGSDKIAVRLGGIYTLVRISREDPNEWLPVMEMLSAFIRERAQWKRPDTITSGTFASYYEEPPRSEMSTDVALVLKIISQQLERRIEHKEWRLDLRATDLRGADLSLCEVNLSCADLKGANLSEKILNTTDFINADLRGANLSKSDLRESNFLYSRLDEADLREANFWQADLSYATLNNADIREVDLRYALGLSEKQLAAARGNAKTRLPEGVAHPPDWPP